MGDWYVDGNRQSSGGGLSLETAFRTIQEGLSALQSGQTLLVKGGVYAMPNRMYRTRAWAATTRIMGYGTDRPIIDATGFATTEDAILRFGSSASNELWHRFYIRNVTPFGSKAVDIAGSNITISDVWASHIMGTGFRVGEDNSGVVLKDCAVWMMGDGSSQHTNVGDGFAATAWTPANYTEAKFVRCVAVNAPDDGFDLWGGRGCEIIDSVSFGSGRYANGNRAGDGNGYKLGGTGNGGGKANTVRGSLSLSNRRAGFDHNHATTTADQTILNNTSYDNGGTGIDYGQNSTTHNNISYSDGSSHYPESGGIVSFNTWQLGITDPDFADVDEHDYSLSEESPAKGVGLGGENLGASTIALEIAKKWLNRDLTGYAQPGWDS